MMCELQWGKPKEKKILEIAKAISSAKKKVKLIRKSEYRKFW